MDIPRTYPLPGLHKAKEPQPPTEEFPVISVSERPDVIIVSITTKSTGRNVQLSTTFGNKLNISYTYRSGKKTASPDKSSRKTEKTITSMRHLIQLPGRVDVRHAKVEHAGETLCIILPKQKGWKFLNKTRR
jgi:hypothetical protein